ncbi:hypothetical protein [Lacipirellula sp.]|uniref:hypothetical protein n=1 Tax=Lacipirellula sp. TaxID=2691419 RepID=UPI003D0F5265
MIGAATNVTACYCLALAEAAAPPQKLSPPASAAVLMALLGIALLGMLLVVIILLGGNWVRKQGKYRRGPSVPPDRLPLRRGGDAEPIVPDSTITGSQASVDTVKAPPINRDETIS